MPAKGDPAHALVGGQHRGKSGTHCAGAVGPTGLTSWPLQIYLGGLTLALYVLCVLRVLSRAQRVLCAVGAEGVMLCVCVCVCALPGVCALVVLLLRIFAGAFLPSAEMFASKLLAADATEQQHSLPGRYK